MYISHISGVVETLQIWVKNMALNSLLVKFIDANAALSVQVHPDDDYAIEHENDNGKNEIWYIITAKLGA